MRMITFGSRTARRSAILLCAGLLLAGCGLFGGRGSVAAGVKYQAAGQYRAAYIEAKKVLQRDSTNGDAWLLLGQASLMLGNPKDALTDLQNAEANRVPEARWVVPMGRALLVTRQFEKLLKTLPADKAFAPEIRTEVLVLRGDAYLGLRQVDRARQSYTAALALNAKDPRALVGLAKLAEGAGNEAAAGRYVQQALAAAPESPQAWVAKGDLATRAGGYAEAESAYQKALDFKYPDWLPQERFFAQGRLADVQIRQNEFGKALANIETLEKMASDMPFPHYLHAVVLYKQGHLDDAISQLQQVLKVSPDNPPAQLLMGAVNYAQGNYGQAEMYLSNVLGVDAKDVSARKLLALAFYRAGNSQQALNTLRPAVAGNPSDAELLAVLQQAVAEGAGMPTASPGAGEPVAVAGSAANPLDAQFARAGQAIVSGNEPEAIQLLKDIPASNASTAMQQNEMLVMAYLRGNHPAEAVKTAADYVAKHPKDSAAHLFYGNALVAAGQRNKGRMEYIEAYKLDSKNLAALLSLGGLDSIDGHYQDAVGRYETVLGKDPRNAAAMTALGQLAARQGDKAQAIKWFK
ncbi:MAG: tetratricopeptide repeat protein, partial [Xanthomonadaceae bacterium]|nr:tetratricopeptide repeat protein [Xanthomonadaceae bacterium]